MFLLKINKYSLYYFLLFLLIYTSNDTLLFGTNNNKVYILIKYILLLISSLILTIKNKKLLKKDLKILFILTALFFINSCFSNFNFGYLYLILILFTATTFTWNVPFDKFLIIFNKIIFILAISSIFIYFINLLSERFVSFFPLEYNTKHNSFYNIYLSMIFVGKEFRNFGIFREPGVFMIYLNLAYFFELFSFEKSKKRLVSYFIAIILTLSTSGYLILFLISVFYLVKKRKVKYHLLFIVILLAISFVLFKYESIYNILFYKIENKTGSYYARLASLTVPLEMFKNNIFGIGPEQYDKMFPQISQSLYGMRINSDISTNTYLKFLAVYGIFIFSFFIHYSIKFTTYYSRDKMLNLFLFFILCLCLSNEDCRNSFFFLLLIAYGFNRNSSNVNISYSKLNK